MHPPECIFDHPSGLQISRDLREKEVATLEGVIRHDMGTGYVWYSLPSWNSESDNILMSLCFRAGTLDSISIALDDPYSGSSCNDWLEQKEQVLGDRTAAWLASQGYPTGTYPWGEIWAGHDAKSGFNSAGIRYIVHAASSNH